MLIEWDDTLFSVGLPEFDRQHRRLVNLLNDLHDLMAEDPGPVAIEKAMSGLRAEVQAHFASEEAYMEEAGSSRLENHRILHDILLTDLDRLIAESRQDQFHFLREDLEYDIKAWLLEHIVNIDKNLPRN